MSEAAVGEFKKAINKNPEIKKEIIDFRNKYPKGELSVRDTYKIITEGIIPIAKKYNFDFNFDNYMDYQIREESGSLDSEDLIEISGGSFFEKLGFSSAAKMLLASTDDFNLVPKPKANEKTDLD